MLRRHAGAHARPRMLIGLVLSMLLGGCAAGPVAIAPVAPDGGAAKTASPDSPPAVAAAETPRRTGPWIGAAGASDFVLAGTTDTSLGVWVDVPTAQDRAHAPASVALVIDTSGSMAGAKIENARATARELVEKLADGDIVSIHTFADGAEERVAPTILSARTRPTILRVIAGLVPSGGTNLFEGLRLGEARALAAPQSHPVRRVVLISDGQANIGPSSPEILGSLAARGAESGTQVTAIGVGLEYDENTLNALAVRSSGRLYHVSEPREMSAMLDKELALLQATAATNAVVEIVPAPGVEVWGADGMQAQRGANGALLVPLGTMFGGQHREMLVRVRVRAEGDGTRPLASVRLKFRDPSDGNLERMQEVVARYQITNDKAVVAAHVNDKATTIVATWEASQATLAAAKDVNEGRYEAADKNLAEAEAKLRKSAAMAKNADDRRRAEANVARISQARAAAKPAAMGPGAPPAPAPRARALDINEAGMKAAGF